MAAKEMIGSVLRTIELPVEAGKIREFARAIHDDNPVFRDAAAAARSGFAAPPAPPTFSVAAAHFSDDDLIGPLGLDLGRVLHGESSWTYHRVPVAGEVLRGDTVVADVFSKPGRQGGEMTFVTLETVYRDQRGEPVVTERMTVIETAQVVSA